MIRSIFIAFVHLTLCTSVAFANNVDAWENVLNGLEDKGIDQIGALNIGDLKKKIATNVVWIDANSPHRPAFAGPRRSGYYDKNVVHLFETPSVSQEIRSQFELHEALGALGYNDQHLQVSTTLEMLNLIEDPKVREPILKELGAGLFSEQSLTGSGNGSGSGVGGGGDVIAISAKNLVLKHILKHKKVDLLELVKLYPFINFEPNYNPKEQYVSIAYDFTSSSTVSDLKIPGAITNSQHGYQELVSLWIPALSWQQNEGLRNQWISELADNILFLLPAHSLQDQTWMYFTCNSKTVTYMIPQLPEIFRIQTLRASAEDGCFNEAGRFTVMAPAFDPNFRIGRVVYHCDFVKSGKKVNQLSYLFDSHYPTVEYIVPREVIDDTYFYAYTHWSEDKTLEKIEVGYLQTEDDKKSEYFILRDNYTEQDVYKSLVDYSPQNNSVQITSPKGNEISFICRAQE